jgi:hypothetical protein
MSICRSRKENGTPLLGPTGRGKRPFSTSSPDLDSNLIMDIPYFGFFLQKGKCKIPGDTGISGKSIIDGKTFRAHQELIYSITSFLGLTQKISIQRSPNHLASGKALCPPTCSVYYTALANGSLNGKGKWI